jgi:hypothetical protein
MFSLANYLAHRRLRFAFHQFQTPTKGDRMEIHAEIESTETLRSGYIGSRSRKPKVQLRGSNATTADKPVVLIRGCRPVELKLVAYNGTAPTPNWELFSGIQRLNGQSLLMEGRYAAKLNTNLKGLYCVKVTQRAVAGGGKEDVAEWYVRFADVSVQSVTHQENQTVRLNFVDENVTCIGGVSYTIVAHIDGGDPQELDKVYVATIQNWQGGDGRIGGIYGEVTETLQFQKLVAKKKTQMGDLKELQPRCAGPYNDSDELKEEWPFDASPKVTRHGNAVTIVTSDVPQSYVPAFISPDHARFYTLSEMKTTPPPPTYRCLGMRGSSDFVIAIAAKSYDAPGVYVAFKLLRWKLSIACAFSPVTSTWKDGEKLIPQGNGPVAVHVGEQTLDPPRDVREAGIETYGPEATGEWGAKNPPGPSDYEWKPKV